MDFNDSLGIELSWRRSVLSECSCFICCLLKSKKFWELHIHMADTDFHYQFDSVTLLKSLLHPTVLVYTCTHKCDVNIVEKYEVAW